MSPVPIKFALDTSGISPANLVKDEPRTLRDAAVRVLSTRYGAFYTDSLAIVDTATNRSLTRGRDFYATMMSQIPTEQYGKEVCSVIIITDPTCGANVKISYQALGGEYSYSAEAIEQMVATLNLDKRPVKWGAIIGKPDGGFTPAPHLHDSGDIYGMEYVVSALERITQAIQLGSAAGEGFIFSYIDAQLKEVYGAIQAIGDTSQTKGSIIAALGYTPANKAGDTVGHLVLEKGITLSGYLKEKIVKIRATTSETLIDISVGSIYEITVAASTLVRFNPSKIASLASDDSISFTVVFKNEVADRGVAFDSNIQWSGGQVPNRTTTLNARDEYYFSTFNGGASYTGSLSDKDVK
jgi:hypothetical protein